MRPRPAMSEAGISPPALRLRSRRPSVRRRCQRLPRGVPRRSAAARRPRSPPRTGARRRARPPARRVSGRARLSERPPIDSHAVLGVGSPCGCRASNWDGLEGGCHGPVASRAVVNRTLITGGAFVVFLATSRVYPVQPQVELRRDEAETRFEIAAEQAVPGVSPAGISERFPLDGARTLYGATKLAAELLIEEYRSGLGVPAVIDRCGVVAGPWQMGKVDQGVFTHWMLAHHFGNPLSYIGFGGSGKQARDLLHIEDLVDLVERQLLDSEAWDGRTVNVGGGRDCSLSLLETTEICRRLTGNEVAIEPVDQTGPGDVPIYLSDSARIFGLDQWRPRPGPEHVLADIQN